jgi:phosphatidylethanolamine/phosphatidyl-N-methylethanolamine N-methyltransferase
MGRRRRRHGDVRDLPGYGDPDVLYRDYFRHLPMGSERGFATRLIHEAVERPFGPDHHVAEALEIGGGDGQHLHFVRHGFDRYVVSDLRTDSLTRAASAWRHDPRVRVVAADAHRLPFADARFDRLAAACVLIHLDRPETALEEWRRVVRPGGWLSFYVPNEPSVVMRVSRGLTTAVATRRAGFHGYDLFIAREHRSSSWSLERIVRHVFRHDQLVVRGFPVRRGPRPLRLFTVYDVRVR